MTRLDRRCGSCYARLAIGEKCSYCRTQAKYSPKEKARDKDLDAVQELRETIATITSLTVYCPDCRKVETGRVNGKPKVLGHSPTSREVLVTLPCFRQRRVITSEGQVGA